MLRAKPIRWILRALLTLLTWSHWGVGSFGLSHCVLSPNKPGLAICTSQAVSNLSSAISHLPNSTLWLNASHNNINDVASMAFSHLPGLLELQLDNNRISSIQPNAFRGLEALGMLDLSWNRLASMRPSMLAGLRNLRRLHLSHNQIASLDPGAFMSQTALQALHLSNNNLSAFQEVATAVEGLANLTFLNLDYNQISTPCVGPGGIVLPALRNLSLNSNGISKLDLSNCSLRRLQQLNLTHNGMLEVDSKSFRATPALLELSLDMNPFPISHLINLSLPHLTMLHLSSMNQSLNRTLTTACTVFRGLSSLTSLDIKHSKLTAAHLSQLGSCTNLTWLDLSTTDFKRLSSGDFSTFPNLEFLSLDKCKLLAVHAKAWEKLRRLRTLILKRNSISQLENALFSPLTSLSYLDLSKNRLTNLQKTSFLNMSALRQLVLQSCQITAVTRDTFYYARKMEYLDLSGNSIKLLKYSAFLFLGRLQTLLLSGNRILTVQSHAFKGLNSLKSLSLDHNYLYKLPVKTFAYLKKLKTLDLSYNYLFTYNKYDHPSPFLGLHTLQTLDLGSQMPLLPICPPDKLFQGLKNLRHLSLRDNPSTLFVNLSFVNLTSLDFLDLSDIYPGRDGFWRLRPNFFQGLKNLTQLRIEDSSIRDLPEQIFSDLGSLEQLSLNKNDLRNISKQLLGKLPSLKYLDASGNPLACSCENLWFHNWSMSEPNIQVALLGSYHCFGPGLTDRLFVQQDLSFCFETWEMYFFAGTTVVILLLLLSALVNAKFGWTLRHGYYLLKGWGHGQLRQKGQDYQYDAYVSCSGQDHEWVVKKLLVKLEEEGEPNIRLCFGPRDFAPGEYFMNNIQNGVSRSRKTLCLVSKSYLEDEWCSLEIQLACSKIHYHGQDPLVMVFLEDIPNYRLSPYHRLRKLINQKSYISWPENPEAENVFWAKLQEALQDSREQEAELIQFNVTE
ncbi:toll-like receptor 13 [Sphaerodactylus townsendi]|uniref:toll-like receptor 13 n=1 Tax=Sphaerodactylus townsendi TaxID=933632 RepID=UPI00202767EC|nr:toll-like receptor 13 [Sphaerodactylus townsendi]